MGKVTFEFNEEEDLSDINFIVNRKKINAVLEEMSNLMRRIDKGYIKDAILVKGNVVLDKENCTTDEVLGAKYYIRDEEIYDEIVKILCKASDFLY